MLGVRIPPRVPTHIIERNNTMNITEKINNDLHASMKSSDKVRAQVLRQLKTAMTTLSINKGNTNVVLSDADVISLIRKQVSQREDSYSLFIKGNRNDLAEKEKIEKSILEEYLPVALSDDEVFNIVSKAVQELGATSKKDTGRVIKHVLHVTNNAVDSRTISQKLEGIFKVS